MKLLAVALAALVLAVPSHAYTRNAALDEVASLFAQRPVTTRCYSETEDHSPWGHGAWGYVRKPLAKNTVLHLDSRVCAGAMGVNNKEVPLWMRALGPLVLAHEAYHLRRWGAAGNEAKVECQAIRHWKVSARLLGATEETVLELWPAALTHHYELANFSGFWDRGARPYYDPDCNVPYLYEEP